MSFQITRNYKENNINRKYIQNNFSNRNLKKKVNKSYNREINKKNTIKQHHIVVQVQQDNKRNQITEQLSIKKKQIIQIKSRLANVLSQSFHLIQFYSYSYAFIRQISTAFKIKISIQSKLQLINQIQHIIVHNIKSYFQPINIYHIDPQKQFASYSYIIQQLLSPNYQHKFWYILNKILQIINQIYYHSQQIKRKQQTKRKRGFNQKVRLLKQKLNEQSKFYSQKYKQLQNKIYVLDNQNNKLCVCGQTMIFQQNDYIQIQNKDYEQQNIQQKCNWLGTDSDPYQLYLLQFSDQRENVSKPQTKKQQQPYKIQIDQQINIKQQINNNIQNQENQIQNQYQSLKNTEVQNNNLYNNLDNQQCQKFFQQNKNIFSSQKNSEYFSCQICKLKFHKQCFKINRNLYQTNNKCYQYIKCRYCSIIKALQENYQIQEVLLWKYIQTFKFGEQIQTFILSQNQILKLKKNQLQIKISCLQIYQNQFQTPFNVSMKLEDKFYSDKKFLKIKNSSQQCIFTQIPGYKFMRKNVLKIKKVDKGKQTIKCFDRQYSTYLFGIFLVSKKIENFLQTTRQRQLELLLIQKQIANIPEIISQQVIMESQRKVKIEEKIINIEDDDGQNIQDLQFN